MAETVKLLFEGKEYEFPIVVGTENERGIDIDKLRALTGLITLDSGYKNTGACKSAITYLDGEKGILRYRGYDIEELAEKADFLEVAYLLVFGELPTKAEYDKFIKTIHKYTLVHEEMKGILDGFPKTAHPMGILASLTSALTAFNPKSVDVSCEKDVYEAVCKVIAKIPVLSSWVYRKREGLPLNYYNNELGYIENILQMTFSIPTEKYKMNPQVVSALNKLLILHGDHEQNCSTSTVRLVGSSHAGLFATISSGVSALWGPLHGGANQAVVEMLEDIKADGGDVEKYINKAKDKDDPFRLMGFGHRVYKNFDPRAKIIKKAADEVLHSLGIDDPIFDIAKHLEKVALEDEYFKSRNLYPNVDFYSGIIYRALGMHVEMFTVLFAIGRLPGWIAQWKEMRQGNEPIGRPRQIYVGQTQRKFVDISKR
ncbi:Citrate synthase 1 [Capnocytophaga canimorsus]|uniref:Citrate synthase n=1 Tax=Capnocytophaga canimorsus TaxID=28188 RepID=A0A0B7H410_9FLAO|nr:citrate synthase [Capnocytophaga canimorsus]ATA76503.1 citrate (Si)-synthase [Capnocytophaga canimorsus]AWL77917.1 citrate synthase [Capnocytophaga canimorsus]PJI77259.1 citrate synthase [Capnocytophaga canimorsus]CEN33244.1 Citrate synthase 1 [Capnocytophaga canimorsus]STA71657.1 Citrate synthase 1 [Capnocytophaga canimorsus]